MVSSSAVLVEKTLPQAAVQQPALPSKARHKIDTAPLMVLACALIVNSHLKGFCPRAFCAADGLLGNSLFYLLSGFGLQLSQASQNRPFLSYYRRRLIRLYPAVIVCLLAFALIAGDAFSGWTVMPYLQRFIWPTHYTFIKAIVPFYAVYYFIMRLRRPSAYWISIAVMVPVYLVLYLPDARHISPDTHLSLGLFADPVHWAAYFQVMLLGGYLATRIQSLGKPGWRIHLATLAILLLYLAVKFVMVVQGRFAACFAVLHLLVFFACGGLLISLTSQRLSAFYRAFPMLKHAINFVAALTLEIYLVHHRLLEYPWIARIKFPLNLLVLVMLALPIAYVLALLCKPIQRLLSERQSAPTDRFAQAD